MTPRWLRSRRTRVRTSVIAAVPLIADNKAWCKIRTGNKQFSFMIRNKQMGYDCVCRAFIGSKRNGTEIRFLAEMLTYYGIISPKVAAGFARFGIWTKNTVLASMPDIC